MRENIYVCKRTPLLHTPVEITSKRVGNFANGKKKRGEEIEMVVCK
jgi:hypothetical protein